MNGERSETAREERRESCDGCRWDLGCGACGAGLEDECSAGLEDECSAGGFEGWEGKRDMVEFVGENRTTGKLRTFGEIVTGLRQMCAEHQRCGDCPLDGGDCCITPDAMDEAFIERVEQVVGEWLGEHSMKLPTWEEWFRETFPNGQITAFQPCTFDEEVWSGCVVRYGCSECLKQTMSVQSAKRLGVYRGD